MRPAPSIVVRAEDSGSPAERSAIRKINEAAFGQPEEADLVDKLRGEGSVLASLVAEIDRRIAGHILFSRMWIDTAEGAVEAAALAPMAVLPGDQRRGIGGELIRHGLKLMRDQSERIVIVLGHPDYYPRFGFSVEAAPFLESPFPKQAFMAIELSPGALEGVHGKVRYSPAFGI